MLLPSNVLNLPTAMQSAFKQLKLASAVISSAGFNVTVNFSSLAPEFGLTFEFEMLQLNLIFHSGLMDFSQYLCVDVHYSITGCLSVKLSSKSFTVKLPVVTCLH